MNIQTRKLTLIEDFLRITDSKLISKIEDMLKAEKIKAYEKSLKPMSSKDFYSMIDDSIDDVKKGKVDSHEDFKKKIKSWES